MKIVAVAFDKNQLVAATKRPINPIGFPFMLSDEIKHSLITNIWPTAAKYVGLSSAMPLGDHR
jgi:hypothetical protein